MIRSIHLNKTSDKNLNELIAAINPKVSVSKYISDLIDKEYESKETENNDGVQEREDSAAELSTGEQNDLASY